MPRVALADVCDIRSGGTPPRDTERFFGGQIPWAKIDDLNTEDGVVRDTTERITDAGLLAIRGRLFEAGTLLLAMYGSVGKTGIAGCDMSANQAILGITPLRENEIDVGYLRRWLDFINPSLIDRANGVTQKNLSATLVRELEVDLPDYRQQLRIANILDKADAIRRMRRESLKVADEFLRSTLLDVALRVRDGSLAGNIAPLSSLLSKNENAIRTGPFGSDLRHSEFSATGIPVVGIENVVTNRFRWTKARCISALKYRDLGRYRIFPGDVIVTIMGTTGRVCVAPHDLPECISTKHLCVITPNRAEVTSNYLWASLLFDPFVRKQAAQAGKGAIMEGWNMNIVKSLEIAVPSRTTLNTFDAAVDRCESVRSNHESLLVESENLFRSLTYCAFNGKMATA